MEFVEVDGSQGEGGGQVLRSAVAFSAILLQPVRVTKIRAGRGVPGLRRQHMSALSVLAKVVGGKLGGATEGSSEITFAPGDSGLGSLSIDMGTAASVTLVLQAVIPATALSRRSLRLELVGGTDVPWSPTFDYFALVVREAYRRIGIRFSVDAARRGYYPRGGGRVLAQIEPCSSLVPQDLLSRGELPGVNLLSRCGSLPRHVAERQLSAASGFIERSGLKVLRGDIYEERSDSPGSSILVHFSGASVSLGSDGIGARGKLSEEVGRGAAERFVAEVGSGACLDSNLADMVIPLLSLARSPSRVRVREVTPHLRTGLEIARQFTSCGWSAEPQERGAVVTISPGPAGGSSGTTSKRTALRGQAEF